MPKAVDFSRIAALKNVFTYIDSKMVKVQHLFYKFGGLHKNGAVLLCKPRGAPSQKKRNGGRALSKVTEFLFFLEMCLLL